MLSIKSPILLKVILCMLVSAGLLAGCNLSASTTPSVSQTGVVFTQDVAPGATYTAAVQTVIAGLTQAANVTPEPGEPSVVGSPTGEPTSTTAPASATAEPSPTGEDGVTPEATTTLTASTSPAPTPVSGDPAASLGSPDFSDTFENTDNWAFATDEHTTMEIADGRLEMVAFKPEHWDGWTITWVNGEDYYLEITAAPGACSGLDRYGLFFRGAIDASEGYLFGLSCDGRYSLRTWDGEEFVRIVDWTANPAIKTGGGQSNRLGVWVEGSTLELYANGVLLRSLEDTSFSEGHIGVYIGSANTENFTVQVDQISWWDLE